MDFYELLKDRNGFDTALILVDCFKKCLISIPCYKTTDAKGQLNYISSTPTAFIDYYRQ
jgi:hypothetical protein